MGEGEGLSSPGNVSGWQLSLAAPPAAMAAQAKETQSHSPCPNGPSSLDRTRPRRATSHPPRTRKVWRVCARLPAKTGTRRALKQQAEGTGRRLSTPYKRGTQRTAALRGAALLQRP